ncbi:MAG TPA: FAD-binding oxidoreductase [Candidatus Dormibacteraeota bacterium]|nr:FAD-binding oxidoreductase [Candidatus Dormibacteraeota bacterium]
MRAELEKIVGSAALDERPVRDMWPLAIMDERSGTAPPRVLVARPSSREQVVAILRWAGAAGVTVTPMGGETGVCGALSPQAGELVLDMGAFDRILDVDETNLTCQCESGMNGLQLERHLNERGLTLGHFPSSLPGTTLGGLIATRSSGQESSRYGSVEDMVLGLEVVLPDGTIAGPRPGPRSAVGPALHQLWLGSEGGLGVILGAVLRVHRLPESVIGRGYGFPDLVAGLAAMREIMQSGIKPLVLRLYDPEDTAFNGYDLPEGGCLLVVANAGLSGVAQAEADAVAKLAAGADNLGEAPWLRWQKHRFDLSAQRLKSFLEPPGSYLDTIELAAPWTVLHELHGRVKPAIAVGGLALCHFSHAYEQGCCAYFTFGGSGDTEQDARSAYMRAWEGAMSIALELGATISHHHGVGRMRARWVADEMGGWMRVWRSIKESVDPKGIMNPRAVGGGKP